MCAAIVGYAEYFGVGDAAPADVLGGLEHNKSFAGCGKSPPRGDAGRAGPHDDGVDPAGAGNLGGGRRARCCDSRRGCKRRGGRKERSAGQISHLGAQALGASRFSTERVPGMSKFFFIIIAVTLSPIDGAPFTSAPMERPRSLSISSTPRMRMASP